MDSRYKYDWFEIRATYLKHPDMSLEDLAKKYQMNPFYMRKRMTGMRKKRINMIEKSIEKVQEKNIKDMVNLASLFTRVLRQLENYLAECERGEGNVQTVYGIVRSLKDMNLIPEQETTKTLEQVIGKMTDVELVENICKVRPHFQHAMLIKMIEWRKNA